MFINNLIDQALLRNGRLLRRDRVDRGYNERGADRHLLFLLLCLLLVVVVVAVVVLLLFFFLVFAFLLLGGGGRNLW